MATQSTKKNISAAGSCTQERLLDAAIDVFGKHGYDAATTRMIAREAQVNIAAIPYYFDGKEGLYRAVINHIVELIATQLQETREEIVNQSFSGPDAKEIATNLLEKLLAKIIIFIVGSPQAPRLARIILREQLYPSAAYDIIFSGFMAATLDALATLLIVISGNPSERTAKLRAMTVMGQILAFRVARETVVRALGMEGYSPEETEEIRQIILEHTRCITTVLACPHDQSTENNP